MKYTFDIDSLDNLRFLEDWLDRYVDYYADTPEIYEEDGQVFESDHVILGRCLSDLKKVLLSKKYVERTKTVKILDTECQSFKNWMYSAERRGRESVNPGWKYCVIDYGLHGDLGVTDDIGTAMFKAASLSKGGRTYYILRIEQVQDGTYKTFLEGECSEGHYYERHERRSWLHYDYIAQGRTIYKID